MLHHNNDTELSTTIKVMPPKLNLYGASRSLVIRQRPSIAVRQPGIAQVVGRRGFAEKEEHPAHGPNQDVLPHVSEEAADIGRVKGETQPEIGQGTPVQDVCSDIVNNSSFMTLCV